MHEFNRIYLLAALIIALIVPFLPTGLEFFSNSSHHAGEVRVTLSESTNGEIHDRFNAMINLSWVLFTIYFLGVIIASLRFARNLYSIVGKTKKGKVLTFGNARLILVDESIAPFTFLNYIFLEKKAFENHDIDEKLLDHELTHVAQNHSWDIIFVELIAIFYWFNPLLYGYKQAIQLNHEFLADASVLSRYKEVRTYQGLLLDMIQPKNKILLASNFNFQLTQKRLKMMTKQSSIRRKTLLQLSVIPILLGVLLGFGNPVIAQNKDKGNENKEQMEIQKVKDTYFKYAQINYQTKDGQVKTVPYQKLDRSIKEKLLPPPPPPPAPPGSKETSWEIEPLPKGSMVYIKEDGSVRIGNGTWSAFPPPPPPPPPAIDGKVQAAPKPPKPPVAPADEMVPRPPKPPTPPSLVDVIDEVDEFYIDGEKSTRKKVLTLWEKSEEKIATIDVKKMENGETAMYIVTQ